MPKLEKERSLPESGIGCTHWEARDISAARVHFAAHVLDTRHSAEQALSHCGPQRTLGYAGRNLRYPLLHWIAWYRDLDFTHQIRLSACAVWQNIAEKLSANNGYLLQHFVHKNIPSLGIESAANVAPGAIEKGLPTEVRFFGAETAKDILREYGHADLLLGNNVLAHVPNLNDFVAGMKILLGPRAVIMEFPHLMQLVEQNQFDTIYHEHCSYFSCMTAGRCFGRST
jgi:hypothetical protein